ncbi:hypothetical protein GALL_511520 [mine drainage metagenome]|uniref:Uncharacterized protein n=1 Tax=mine drainage metagenome TaxID=410659 RepID=A0A1J5PHJ5_9ZZZZ
MGRVKRQQHRGLNSTAVNAKTLLVGAKQRIEVLPIGIEQGQVEPADAVHQQAQTRAQVTCHQIHHAHIATMGVEQHQFADAGSCHRLGNVGPEPQHGFILECQGAGKTGVFGAQAD